MQDKSSVYKIWIIIISIVLVICIPFISGSRDGREDFIKAIYGFPADWLYLYTNGGFSFLGIGFIVNIIFFYYMIKILIWAYKKIIGWIKGIWANLYY